MLPRTANPPPDNAADDYRTLLNKLTGAGVMVIHSDLDYDAEWNPATRTMHLRAGAPIAKHVRELNDLLQIACSPRHPTRARPIGRHLHAVP